MSKVIAMKGIWIVTCSDKTSKEELKYCVIANSKLECRELITEKEYELELMFVSIIKIGNIAPTLINESTINWDGESMIILSNSPY